MAKAHQNTLSGDHYRLTEESFNSSLAHQPTPNRMNVLVRGFVLFDGSAGEPMAPAPR